MSTAPPAVLRPFVSLLDEFTKIAHTALRRVSDRTQSPSSSLVLERWIVTGIIGRQVFLRARHMAAAGGGLEVGNQQPLRNALKPCQTLGCTRRQPHTRRLGQSILVPAACDSAAAAWVKKKCRPTSTKRTRTSAAAASRDCSPGGKLCAFLMPVAC